jgi:hypothetical protein
MGSSRLPWQEVVGVFVRFHCAAELPPLKAGEQSVMKEAIVNYFIEESL